MNSNRTSSRLASLLTLSAITLVGSHSAQAADRTWDGGGTDNNWNTSANWDAAVATADSLFFAGSTRLTPTNNTTANSDYNITFNSGAGAFTLSGNAIDLISGGFIVNNSANAQAVNHAVELLGNGTLTSNGGTLTIGGALTEAGGTLKTLNVNGAGNVTISGAISASNGDLDIIKTGSGTLTLSGSNGGLNDNTVALNAGTLVLDYTADNTKLDTSVLTLGGGTLTSSGGTFTQNMTSVTLSAGASSITRSSGTATLQMNTITRNLGATLNIGADNGDIANNDGAQNDGIIGGYFTVAGTTWATNGGDATDGAITGLATYETSTTQGNWAATENISLSANPTASVTTRTINSLRLTDAVTFTITAANILTLDTGGLLATGTGATNITGGTLTIAGAATDLVVHQYSSADMSINSVIANTTGADALTKTGTGRLILGNANTYTGETFVNQGILGISANNNLGAAGTGARLNLDGGTLEATSTFGLFNGSAGTNNRAVTLADKGGTIAVTGSNTLTVAGVVSGVGGLIKTDTGKLTLSGANTYTGETTLTAGTVSVATIGNGGVAGNLGQATNAAANLVFDGGTLQYTGATASTNRNFTVNSNKVASIDVSANTLTISGASTSTNGGLNKAGAGTLILSGNNLHTGDTIIKAGTLKLDGSGNVASTNIIVGDVGSSGAVLDATTMTGGFIIGNGKTVGGIGTINGSTTIQLGGTLAPGNSTGILNLGNIDLQAGSNFNIELGGTTPGTGYDQLNVTGSVTLAGLLAINTGLYVPNNGDLFFLIANDGTDAIAGKFSNANYNDSTVFNLGGRDWLISYTANFENATPTFTGGNDVALMAVPEPNAALIGGIGVLLLLRRRRA